MLLPKIMSKIVYLALLFLVSQNVFADCDGNGIDFWPIGKTIKQNSIIMIDGYAESQHVIIGLNKQHPVYLKSKSHKVPLTVIEVLSGEFWITQAILRPNQELKVGEEYQLIIDSLPEYEKPVRKWNPSSKEYEQVRWTVVEGIDLQKPQFSSIPIESKKMLEYYGCGPASYVVFGHKVNDDSEYLIKTEVTNLATNKKTSYYLTTSENEIYVGHGMCSGAFKLVNGQEYEVKFEIIDASGNFGENSKVKLKFTAPSD